MDSLPRVSQRAELPELVIFDCDGVLVDSEKISNRVLAETLTELGLPTTTEEAYAEYKGRMLANIGARAEARSGVPLADGWIERFEARRAEAFRNELVAIPGAREAVTAVSAAGINVCVATQGKPEKSALTLGITGLRDLFGEDAVFTSYEVPRGKPHPDLFLHAAGTMGVEPARCVVVEDSALGVEAAVAAGMAVFGYAPATDAASLEAAGAKTFLDMADLSVLLGV